MMKYACEFKSFDDTYFVLYADNERALTECLMFARDDSRIVSWKFIKIEQDDEDE